jgi:hypothetical protein
MTTCFTAAFTARIIYEPSLTFACERRLKSSGFGLRFETPGPDLAVFDRETWPGLCNLLRSRGGADA